MLVINFVILKMFRNKFIMRVLINLEKWVFRRVEIKLKCLWFILVKI